MNIKNLFLLSIGALTISANAADWKKEIIAEMDKGNFTTAVNMLDALPAEIKTVNQYSIDSLNLIINRIRYDFSITPDKGINMIREKIPTVTTREIADWIDNKYIETMTIDGKEMWFRKAIRNLWLLNPELVTETAADKEEVSKYHNGIIEAFQMKFDKNNCSNWHRAKIKFVLDVDADAVPAGESINAWLPIPLATSRQKGFKLISSSSPATYSQNSPHRTVQLTQTAKAGEKTHFEIEFTYDVAAQSFSQDYLLKNLKPYKTDTDDYKYFTSADGKHIIVNDFMRNLAKEIVGSETNPVLQAAKIYDWIVDRYPWAGARDYGTIKNIPMYVLENNHGDCGQVSLLYISLTRSIGIPSRWESGWVITPSNPGWHDWAETYFEGIGWVPTDVSVGRTTDKLVKDYYKTGTDIHRFASNCDYAKPLSPNKTYLRSEPIDFQAGEVEWKGGNVEMTQFDSELIIESFNPIKY